MNNTEYIFYRMNSGDILNIYNFQTGDLNITYKYLNICI